MPQVIPRFVDQYDFLSNFYPAKVVLDGETYFSTEHAYQAAKTLGHVGPTAAEVRTRKRIGGAATGYRRRHAPGRERLV